MWLVKACVRHQVIRVQCSVLPLVLLNYEAFVDIQAAIVTKRLSHAVATHITTSVLGLKMLGVSLCYC